MNCYSCKKPLDSSSINYCVHCGAELSGVNEKNYINTEILGGQTPKEDYKQNSNATFVKNSDLKIPTLDDIKKIFYKNKLVSIVVCILLVLSIGGYGTYSYINGLPVKESVIKKDIMGKTVNIGGKNVTIDDRNLKSFKIGSRSTTKKSSDYITLDLTLKLDNADVKLNAESRYYYSKKWIFNRLSEDTVREIIPTTKVEDVAKDLITKSKIYVNSTDIKLDSDKVKAIKLGNVESKDLDKNIETTISVSNGITKLEIPAIAKFEFSKSELQWTLKKLDVESNKKLDYELESKIEDKTLENYVKTAFESGMYGKFIYKDDKGREETDSIDINKEDIAELKVTNYKLDGDNKYLRTEVQGKCKNGDIKTYDISGVITLTVTLGKPYVQLKELNITNLVNEEITDEIIKNGLLDKHIKSQIVTTDILKTFKVTNKLQKNVFQTRVNGTIDINGTNEEIQFYVQMERRDKKYKWNIRDYIYTKDSFGFEK